MLKAGVAAVIVISILLYGISFTSIIRGKQEINFARRFFTPGLLVFCMTYVVLTTLNYGRMAMTWDEFSHWADVVRAMVNVDDFSTNPETRCLFQSYMPGMSLFQYFGQELHLMLDAGADFSEWRLYFSYHIFSCAFILPFLKHLSFRRLGSGAILFCAVCLLPMGLFNHYFPNALYIDAFVGIVAGAGFALVYCERRKNTLIDLEILSALFVLVFAKDVGMLYAVFLALATVADRALSLRDENQVTGEGEKERRMRFGLQIAGIAAAVLLPKALWNANIAAHHTKKSFSQPIVFRQLLDVLTGTDQTYRTDVLHSFIQRFFERILPIGSLGISLSAAEVFSILAVGLMGIHLIYRRAGQKKSSGGIIVAIMLVQVCFYIAGLCVLYMFRFGEYEARILASFDRYLSIAFLTMQMMLVLVCFSYMQWIASHWYAMCLIALTSILLVLPVEGVRSFITRSSVTESIQNRAPYESLSAKLKEITQGERKRVYIISQQTTGYDFYVLRYSIRPCTTNSDYPLMKYGEYGEIYGYAWSLSMTGPLYEGDMWTWQRTPEQWKAELQDFDYVMIYHTDETFIRNYASVFADAAQIADGQIYEVDHQTGLLVRCQ